MNFASGSALKRRSVILCVMAVVYVMGTAISTLIAAEAQLADQAITDAVEDELAHDWAVAAVKIVVRPDQDVSDEALRKDVITALQVDPVSDALELDVEVTQGVVTLTGTVQSWQEQQAAAGVAKGIRGVTDVVNRTEIHYATTRPNGEIRADIVHSLNRDVFVDDALIEVRVQNGKAYLTGTVGSAAEKRAAIADAGVTGVKAIKASGLDVKHWARDPRLRQHKYVTKSDAEIRQAVADALHLNPRVKAYRVVPEVSDSTVTLRGTVDNLGAKRAAAQVARRIVGVVRVENRLKVRMQGTSIKGDTLAADVRGALTRDPHVSRYGITVKVISGTARLYGTVDSRFEKIQAEQAASRVRGIVDVKNYLRVLKARHRWYMTRTSILRSTPMNSRSMKMCPVKSGGLIAPSNKTSTTSCGGARLSTRMKLQLPSSMGPPL